MEDVKKESFWSNRNKIIIAVIAAVLLIGSVTTVFLLTRKEERVYYLCENDEVGTYVEYTNEYIKLVGESNYITVTQPPQSFWDKYKNLDDLDDRTLEKDLIDNYVTVSNMTVNGSGSCFISLSKPSKNLYNT